MTECYDYVIIGSGFGGSVSALRLAEKGYSVLVLERGKEYKDQDFPKTNWNIWKWLWLPVLRCFGIFEMVFLNGAIAMRGSGVGGGSLMYANVLLEPDERLFDAASWHHLADWKTVLKPFYEQAGRMLGVTANPRFTKPDEVLQAIARERDTESSFQLTRVGVFFGQENVTVPDPYFDGSGPERAGCNFCGGCMVGCRYNAKNTLVKNYLFFARKHGAWIMPDRKVKNILPISSTEAPEGCGARYRVETRITSGILPGKGPSYLAKNVILSAGTLGTLELLFRCREITKSLPLISDRLGDLVRSNSENLQGVIVRGKDIDYSKGIAIGSITRVDADTYVEPVRFSPGSSFISLLTAPLVDHNSIPVRFVQTLWAMLRHPLDYLYAKVFAPWAQRVSILLMMQPVEELLRMHLKRSIFSLFRRGLAFKVEQDRRLPGGPPIANQVTRQYSRKVDGIPLSTFMDSLFKYPITAHMMGGVPLGRDSSEGVIDLDFQVHNYPGLYVVDGSVMPGNPGVNPSLTITALAEYAMSRIPRK